MALGCLLLVSVGGARAEDPQAPNHTRRALPSGVSPNNDSFEPRIGSDGNAIVFRTAANLGLGSNGKSQVYLIDRDKLTGTLTRTLCSVTTAGAFSPEDCLLPSVSMDGKVVVFHTKAALVTADTNAKLDVYVRDFRGASPVTRRISMGPATPAGGGNGASHSAVVSDDGVMVAFTSSSTDLLASDLNGALNDVFVINSDGTTSSLVRVSVQNAGAQSATAGFTTSGGSTLGRAIASFPVDGGFRDTFVVFHGAPCDWDTNCTGDGMNCLCAAVSNACLPGCTGSPQLVQQVYLREVRGGNTFRVSRTHRFGIFTPGNNTSWGGSLSADGAFVAFSSIATNLGATNEGSSYEDVFVIAVADIDTEGVLAVNLTSVGTNHSSSPMLSSDGDEIAFTSNASNLVMGDTNNSPDIFVRDRLSASTLRRYNVSSQGAQASSNSLSGNPAIAGEGKVVVYESTATNLISGDTNGFRDVFETISGGRFLRGDAKADGIFDPAADSAFLNAWLFQGSNDPPDCLDAADANDDVVINLSDVLVIGSGCSSCPAPGSASCGNEPVSSGDGLTCAQHACP